MQVITTPHNPRHRERRRAMKYKLSFNGKEYRYNGKDCEEVISKFANRKVFGNPIVWDYRIKQYDADTRGERWAVYHVNKEKSVLVEIDN